MNRFWGSSHTLRQIHCRVTARETWVYVNSLTATRPLSIREKERESHTHTQISKDPNLQLTCAGAAIIKGSVTMSSKGGPSFETLLEWANCAWPRGVLAAAASWARNGSFGEWADFIAMLTRGAAAGFARKAKSAGVLQEEEEEEEAENFLKSDDLGFLRHTRLPLVRIPHSTIAISPIPPSLRSFLSVCLNSLSLSLLLSLSLSLSLWNNSTNPNSVAERMDFATKEKRENHTKNKQSNCDTTVYVAEPNVWKKALVV